MSRFPLLGAHRTADCSQCHVSESLLKYNVAGVNCVDCHRADYMATKNPDHIKSGMSEECVSCHSVNSLQWSGGSFNHNSFPLVQGHSTVRCIDCHTTGSYSAVSRDCYSCHQHDFVAAKTPDHVSSAFSTNCQTCHTLVLGWKPAAFDHTKFPLTLGHSTANCIDCHKDGNYAITPTDCYSCHKTDFMGTTNPNHVTSGMSTTCQTCHTTTPGWKPAAFNHGSFPLTLGHSATACADCHKNGNYTSTSTDCNSCHNQDYRATTNPNHVTAGFPTICQSCHTTTPGWKPATFNHTKFPLTLGHSSAACTDCHKNGNYTTTPTDCYSCHQTDFINTTNPNHSSLSFSTTCTQCHTTTPGWKPATFTQHDALFPIYTGNHRGKWDACSDCHNNSASYAVFNCISCHSNEHPGKNYTNAQCYSCHPRGTGD
jgi:predicted CXXCH cytochrome family protein